MNITGSSLDQIRASQGDALESPLVGIDGIAGWLPRGLLEPFTLTGNGIGVLAAANADQANLTVSELGGVVKIASGGWNCELQVESGIPQLSLRMHGRALAAARKLVEFKDYRGRSRSTLFGSPRIIDGGPKRVTIEIGGVVRTPREVRLRLQLSFFAGTGLMRMKVTIHNTRRARHPGGVWDLGDEGSVFFRELALRFSLAEGQEGELAYRIDTDGEFAPAPSGQLEVYQDSSGGSNWSSAAHVDRNGRSTTSFRGCRIREGSVETFCIRPQPVVSWRTAAGEVLATIPEFWQQFPNSIGFANGQLVLGLFPQQDNQAYELQGGERKSKCCWLSWGEPEGRECFLNVVDQPPIIRSVCRSGSVSQVPASDEVRRSVSPQLEAYLEESRQTLIANRERVDQYGWRNYGDVFADHEQTYYTGSEPLVSHYNNQFDMVLGFLLQFLRTGDSEWFKLGDALARHVVDIDIYHTDQDKAAYNGGLFWFTDHYLHAHTSTHRTYSGSNRPAGKAYGGGPGAEHNFTSGLLLHYGITGRQDSRAAVLELAEWVINMDDGRLNLLGVLYDGPTGLASGPADYHGPSRAGGNSVNALLDAWLLTGGKRYLDFAETLIQRCIHPHDDVAARGLLDVERRWSYTVFLSSLAKYLEIKAEAQQIDRMYAYGRAALLHYADWMLAHELPYFDQYEKLEYPTEAWAAQEFRKANVLRWAALHADEPLRTQLLDRGDQLGERAWQDLMRFETRTYARAMAIVMVEGLLDGWFRRRDFRPATQIHETYDFGEPELFVPQKHRVKRQLRSPRGSAVIAMRLLNPARWLAYRSHLRWLRGATRITPENGVEFCS